MNEVREIANLLHKAQSSEEIYGFLLEILTPSELITLSKRWRILRMLSQKHTQREIAARLNVSLCKITRGAKILKNLGSITNKYL
ncbi:MAG: trp operon repressor, partial [Opitutales bacterium]|nr:trp operon repressor [Opitutales bacterium]